MKLKIPLPSFDRTPHQHSDILRNRYVIDIDTSDYSFFNIVHEALNPKMEWYSSYSWWTLGVNTAKRSEVWKDEIPDKVFLFGLLKRYDAYYDGPIITWELGPVFINYRW
jgi:hypothetical protein